MVPKTAQSSGTVTAYAKESRVSRRKYDSAFHSPTPLSFRDSNTGKSIDFAFGTSIRLVPTLSALVSARVVPALSVRQSHVFFIVNIMKALFNSDAEYARAKYTCTLNYNYIYIPIFLSSHEYELTCRPHKTMTLQPEQSEEIELAIC